MSSAAPNTSGSGGSGPGPGVEVGRKNHERTSGKAWPPVLTWENPIATDANGVTYEATAAWLEARWGAPEHEAPGPAVPVCDAFLDELLASAGFERVPNA